MNRSQLRPRAAVFHTAAIAAVFAATAAGCGSGNSLQRAAVDGTVTLGGRTLDEGVIGFYPVGGTKGPAVGTSVKNGRYSIAAAEGPVVGAHRVEIRGPKKTGRQVQAPMADPGVMADETVEAVPAKYNADSKLIREVAPGKNRLDFELDSE